MICAHKHITEISEYKPRLHDSCINRNHNHNHNNMDSPSSSQQQQQQILSAATTPAGSAYSLPSSASSTLSSSGSILVKALAPKKLLKKREPPRACTVIQSRTIFPSTKPKPKPDYTHLPVMVLDPENPVPIKRSTFQEQGAEVANDLPAIPYRKRTSTATPSTAPGSPRRSVAIRVMTMS